MYFSSRVIEDLVVSIAAREGLHVEDVHHLIYHLKLPGEEIPRFIARVIADKPRVGGDPSTLAQRLAYGILDDGWSRFDDDQRYKDQTKLCRQVSQIGIGLQKLEHPAPLISIFESLFSSMVFASNACNDLGTNERELRNLELGTLVEGVIEALLVRNEETKRLLDVVVRRFRREEKNRLRNRVSETISRGMQNEPWDDSTESAPIFDLDGPIRFRLSLFSDSRFPEAAGATIEYIGEISSH